MKFPEADANRKGTNLDAWNPPRPDVERPDLEYLSRESTTTAQGRTALYALSLEAQLQRAELNMSQRDDGSGSGAERSHAVSFRVSTGVPHLERACELLWQAGHPRIAEALEGEVRDAQSDLKDFAQEMLDENARLIEVVGRLHGRLQRAEEGLRELEAVNSRLVDHNTECAEAADKARETQRELHRRVQAAESVAASVNGKTIERLDEELARVKVERHEFRHENAFMKNERVRLKRRVRDLEAELGRRLPPQNSVSVMLLQDRQDAALPDSEPTEEPGDA